MVKVFTSGEMRIILYIVRLCFVILIVSERIFVPIFCMVGTEGGLYVYVGMHMCRVYATYNNNLGCCSSGVCLSQGLFQTDFAQ